MSDIYHLKVGDVIDLNKPRNSSVKLFVGRQPWFTGQMGVYKKNMAIRSEERTYEVEDGQEAGEEEGTFEPAYAPEAE